MFPTGKFISVQIFVVNFAYSLNWFKTNIYPIFYPIILKSGKFRFFFMYAFRFLIFFFQNTFIKLGEGDGVVESVDIWCPFA